MISLNNQQKQLLFDYCIGITSETEKSEAQKLTTSNKEAAELHAEITKALSPLDSIESKSCPDNLAEGTIWRLTNAARASELKLQQLLAVEQTRTISKSFFWRNFGQLASAAAMIIFVAGIIIAPLNHIRQDYWQKYCQSQLQRIGQGINAYSADNEDKMPAVATTLGSPWWKVGYQGKENHSNTRHMWLLAKNNYVTPTDFVCPGAREGKAIQFDSSQAKNYSDFPARRYVTYSSRIICKQPSAKNMPGQNVLIADLNPLFERLPQNTANSLDVKLSENQLNLNSSNHCRRGQNVLFCNGSVEFVKTRQMGILQDDIFTLRDTNVYKGVEVPSCETDAFLAP
jgi:hypothetical protein